MAVICSTRGKVFARSCRVGDFIEATRRFLSQAESVSLARRFVDSALIGCSREAVDVVALLTRELGDERGGAGWCAAPARR